MKQQTKSPIKLFIIAAIVMAAVSLALMLLSGARESNSTYITIDPETVELVQLQPPQDGDPIAIVDTTLGEFRFVLYTDRSPLAVKNFTELAESGYYDGTYVFNSESGAYSAAGCPQKSGSLPEGYDTSRELITRELSQDLWPFRGAVMSLNSTVDRGFKEYLLGGGDYYNGSRFALINTVELTDEEKTELTENSAVEGLGQAFAELGGIPNFSQQMTVIGQTYEGLDVIEALASLETSDNGIYKIPVDDIMINSVVISTYSSGENGSTGE